MLCHAWQPSGGPSDAAANGAPKSLRYEGDGFTGSPPLGTGTPLSCGNTSRGSSSGFSTVTQPRTPGQRHAQPDATGCRQGRHWVQTTFATQSEDLGGCPVSSKGDRSNRRSRSMASSPRVRCTERPVLAPPPYAISASPRRRHRARESPTSVQGRPWSLRAGRSAASGPAMPGPPSPGAAEPPRPGRCVLPPRGVLLHGG